MKHLKIYENFNRDYKIQDFLDIPYWYYKNPGINSILKVEFLNTDESKWNSYYKYTLFDIEKNTFNELILKNDFLYSIMQVEEKILRPATEQEVELFKTTLLTTKYNL